MGKIFLNGVDYSATSISDVTGVKGNVEKTYRKGNVNLTPANIGALAVDGNAVSATKAEQDGNGNNIAETYVKKTDALTGDYLPLSGGKMNNSSQVSFNGDTEIDTGIKMTGSKFTSYYHPAYIDFRNGNTGHEFDAAELRSDYLRLDGESNTYSTVRANSITVHDENTECIVKSDGIYVDGVKVGNIANSIRDPRNGSLNTLSYDGTITNPTYIAAWNNRTIEKYPMSSLDSKYAKATHNHDDRYYTETEIDTLLKNIMPASLNCIQTGHFMYSGTEAFDKIFYSTNSNYKRSLCLLTSLYITIPNKNTQYHSQYREVAVHMIDWADVEYDTWSPIAHTNKLITSSNNTQNVSANNKHQWLHTRVNDESSDEQLDLKFSMQSMLGGNNINGGTLYVSWIVIM